MAYALNAARLSSADDEDALLKCLDEAKHRASKQRQEVMKKYGTVLTEEQAGKYAAARAVCDDMISRGSILQDNFTGGGKILQDAMEDGSSLVCVRCGALIARTRLEQHRLYWCDRLNDEDSKANRGSDDNNSDFLQEPNSDFDMSDDSDVDMDDMTCRFQKLSSGT